MRILSIGETIWDIFPHAEHLGGAPLTFAAHARRLGHEVFLLSAVGDDERGPKAIERIAELRVAVDFIQRVKGMPTGIAAVEVNSAGQPQFAIARPAAYDRITLTDETLVRIADLQPDWIYFGTLFHTTPSNLAMTRRIVEACPLAYRLYDMNLRGTHWSTDLVVELSKMASLVKASDDDLNLLRPSVVLVKNVAEADLSAAVLLPLKSANAVIITRGAHGCIVRAQGQFVIKHAFPVEVADTVGAGDAFAAGFIHALDEPQPIAEAARFANAVAALVASRPGAIPEWSLAEVNALLAMDET